MIGLLGLVAQLSVVARAPQSAGVCEPITVTVAARSWGGAMPTIATPSVAPFELLRASLSPRLTIDSAGAGSVLAEFSYVLAISQAGTFDVPSFTVRAGRLTGRSQPVRIVVAGAREGAPGVMVRAQVDTGTGVNTRPIAEPETVFVGQQANYQVVVFLTPAIQSQLKHNPTFFPPDIQSMLAYDLPSNGSSPQSRGSRCFGTLAYERAIFPLAPGRVAIPPAQLVYSLPITSGFFSREESHQLTTDSAAVVAIEVPTAGRPADYAGAVGDIHLTARLDTTVARVGDPVVLTVGVSGTGNVKLFPRPSLQISWGSVVAADERVRIDSAAWHVRGTKEFDWIVTPRVPGESDFPPIRYSYFDPERRRYEEAAASAPRLRVVGGTLASTDTTQAGDLLPLRLRDGGAVGRPWDDRPAFWIALALIPLPALGVRRRRRRRRTVPGSPALSALLRLQEAVPGAPPDPATVRRAYATALADRLGLTSETFSRPGAVARALRRAGASPQLAVDSEEFMRQLDAGVFARHGRVPPDACDRAVTLYTQTDAETLPAAEIRAAGMRGMAAFAVFGAVAIAVVADSPASIFQRGIEAYRHHAYSAAEAAFGLAALAEIRSPDAWANYGTAAWASGDTAHAADGWQRAVRLDPLAPDLRHRIGLVSASSGHESGVIPPVPADGPFALGLLLWACAWAIAGRRALRRVRMWVAHDLLLVVAAVAAVLWGIRNETRLTGRGLAVVRSATVVLTDPTLGGAGMASVATGEVVHVAGERGAWSRLVFGDGRTGWIETTDLLPLDEAHPHLD